MEHSTTQHDLADPRHSNSKHARETSFVERASKLTGTAFVKLALWLAQQHHCYKSIKAL